MLTPTTTIPTLHYWILLAVLCGVAAGAACIAVCHALDMIEEARESWKRRQQNRAKENPQPVKLGRTRQGPTGGGVRREGRISLPSLAELSGNAQKEPETRRRER